MDSNDEILLTWLISRKQIVFGHLPLAVAVECSVEQDHRFSFPLLDITGALLGISWETFVAIVIQRIKPREQEIPGY